MTQAAETAESNEFTHIPDEMVTLEGPISLSPEMRGEVDVQITTAKRFPRSIRAFKQQALEMATFDEETAAGCFYSLPRGGKPIEGPSARLAEIVLSAWGNVRADAKVVSVGEKDLTAEAMTWDLEKNVAIRVQVKRRITDKNGRRYSDDMIVVTGNAACSIALRNSVFKVIPMVYTKSIYQTARQIAIGDVKTLAAKRAEMVEYFGKMGVTADRVFGAIGKPGIEEVGLDELAMLKGTATAIRDGDITVDEAFPPIAPGGPAGVSGLKERMKNGKQDPEAKPESPTVEESNVPADDQAPDAPDDARDAETTDEPSPAEQTAKAFEIYRGLEGDEKSKADKFLKTKGIGELGPDKLADFLNIFGQTE